MKSKFVICFIGCFCLMTTTGCWDRVEVKDLAIVLATGIDKTEQGVKVSLQVAIPTGIGGNKDSSGRDDTGVGKNYFVKTAIGRNIKDAGQHLQDQLPRKLFIAHRKVIVISENMERSGISKIIDPFERDPSNRLNNLFIVAKGTQAEQILANPTFLEVVPGENLRKLTLQQSGMRITMLNFLGYRNMWWNNHSRYS